jgi:hypothetical protein
MPEYIKYVANAFAILFIIITLIIGLIFRKNRFETSNDDLSKVFYLMLVTSTIMIYVAIIINGYF